MHIPKSSRLCSTEIAQGEEAASHVPSVMKVVGVGHVGRGVSSLSLVVIPTSFH